MVCGRVSGMRHTPTNDIHHHVSVVTLKTFRSLSRNISHPVHQEQEKQLQAFRGVPEQARQSGTFPSNLFRAQSLTIFDKREIYNVNKDSLDRLDRCSLQS